MISSRKAHLVVEFRGKMPYIQIVDDSIERSPAVVQVVIAELKKPKTRHGDKGSVREKSLRDAAGRAVRVLSLDANSATFSDDLTRVFARNVAKARRENKRLFGSASGGLGAGRAVHANSLNASTAQTAKAREERKRRSRPAKNGRAAHT